MTNEQFNAERQRMADQRDEARRHAVELEQCALFVDSPPLARSMTDAAAFIRRVLL